MLQAKGKTVTIKIVGTTDVHGSFFPYDFINRKPKAGSLARVSSYVNRLRAEYGENVILLENGDILQGQPVTYYSNYIDTLSHNIAADLINYMRYDAQTIGNHDVETGHKVYDKWISELDCPVLGANIIDTATGKPYVEPYTILKRSGVKIAVLGMITPAIPNWLPKELWTGLHFEEMVASARRWVKILKEKEKPDVIVGLFHSGREGGITTPDYTEDASLTIAREVPGFNVIMFGHDHTRFLETIKNNAGGYVLCMNPANNAMAVGEATLTLERNKGKWQLVSAGCKLPSMVDEPVDQDFTNHFKFFTAKVSSYADEVIGEFGQTIYTRDSYFGNSAFNDLILNLQLQVTGADISFNAPLSFDEHISQGPVRVSDMFNLYKYENQLYVIRMTGEEIRRHLEMSYDQWVNTMTSPNDHLLLLDSTSRGDAQRYGFKNFTFNFDSAAGIDYEVDVTKSNGQKVKILQMSNGRPFDEKAWYKVAVNSYRANGGGELLTRGAGIAKEDLERRIVWRSDKDQRHYLMEEIRKARVLNPKPNHNWRFVPEAWVKPAAERDRQLLFGHRQQRAAQQRAND
ncbi:bifunctional metallophosphatase/5'-nucleotidase [Hallella bergensis]|uniref:bifunctional metallophosphatase/5'-nucleotidase n=1 Tax=Hallella bergensis TaxID=242750 RepID=UPI0023F17185|nr:bifunctional metallophosphatase/5'-nucleotidase [Hallella bergensis]